jgi:hypothetical protein
MSSITSYDTEFSWTHAFLLYLCIPCILVVNAKDRYRESKKPNQSPYLPLTPLPHPRPRALSSMDVYPAINILKSEKAASRVVGDVISIFTPKTPSPPPAAGPCLLLDRLPLEIRRLIYSQTLGNNVFRIKRQSQSLGHSTCTHPMDKSRGHLIPCGVCYADVDNPQGPYPRSLMNVFKFGPEAKTLALLQTCRQM